MKHFAMQRSSALLPLLLGFVLGGCAVQTEGSEPTSASSASSAARAPSGAAAADEAKPLETIETVEAPQRVAPTKAPSSDKPKTDPAPELNTQPQPWSPSH